MMLRVGCLLKWSNELIVYDCTSSVQEIVSIGLDELIDPSNVVDLQIPREVVSAEGFLAEEDEAGCGTKPCAHRENLVAILQAKESLRDVDGTTQDGSNVVRRVGGEDRD